MVQLFAGIYKFEEFIFKFDKEEFCVVLLLLLLLFFCLCWSTMKLFENDRV